MSRIFPVEIVQQEIVPFREEIFEEIINLTKNKNVVVIDVCANHLCHEIAQSFQILINIICYFVDQILYLIM